MRIENLRKEKNGTRARLAATVTWEDCDRSRQELYFETEEALAEGLSSSPHAFLVAAGIPAMHYGESRVLVEGEVCPELRDGLNNVYLWFRRWYDTQNPPLVIEAPSRRTLPAERTPERAGLFLSGGVDSFATLCGNHLSFSPEHPYHMKDGFYIYGLGGQAVPEAYEMVRESLLEASRKSDITLIPVYTNIYDPYREEDIGNHFAFWLYKYMAASLAAVAHAFDRRITLVTSGSCEHILDIFPYGHHPLIDPNYSSANLRVRLDGTSMTRFAKTRLIADWDVALQHLRVCNHYRRFQDGILNCGECEKCLRTKLSLLALEKLSQATVFPNQEVVAEDILSILSLNDISVPYYRELIAPLEGIGRTDLVEAIEYKINEYAQNSKKEHFRSKIKEFDKKYLNESILKARHLFKHVSK